jgi:hypothetical protein
MMLRVLTIAFLGASLALTSGTLLAAQTVREFSGSSNRVLPEFEVRAPWILEWRVSADTERQSAVDVSLEQAGTAVHQGNVLKVQWTGNGVRLFEQDGRFQFRVASTFATWHLKVVQLTAEEARAYTPKEKRSALD